MKDLTNLPYFKSSEDVVNILRAKTQNEDSHFFRILVAYYFCKVAAIMRCSINTNDRGNIPINMYAISLAVSGYGKNHSINILEGEIINNFRERFTQRSLPVITERRMYEIANKRSAQKATDPEKELELVKKEYVATGEYLFSFDSGTAPAFKQQRHKLLMIKAGSLNLEIDEIGSNLSSCAELITTYLETYDQGLIKQKLIKNTTENTRGKEIYGKVPTNLLMFGTPSKLMNGGKEEEDFMNLLLEGYGRRCFFGNVPDNSHKTKKTASELYDTYTNPANSQFIHSFSRKLGALADEVNLNKEIKVSREVSILLIEYRLYCEERAAKLPEHDELKRAEISHRDGKALKLAGAYAFIEGSYEITEELLYNAIRLTEDSGISFNEILDRDRNYVKLAKYISNIGRDVTLVDLTEDLPLFKGSVAQKNELLSLAITYGYKNNIIIKKNTVGNIDFYSGESLEETNLNKLLLSYSLNEIMGYKNYANSFSSFEELLDQSNGYWCNHHYENDDRAEKEIIQGFNVVCFDIKLQISIKTLKEALKEYVYYLYSFDDDFKIVFPLSHIINLSKEDYIIFINNIIYYMPFDVLDDSSTLRSTIHRCIKDRGIFNYKGDLLNALQFIPNTTKEGEWHDSLKEIEHLSNLERWILRNRENEPLIKSLNKYGQMLLSAGVSNLEAKGAILLLNEKLKGKLTKETITREIFPNLIN